MSKTFIVSRENYRMVFVTWRLGFFKELRYLRTTEDHGAEVEAKEGNRYE